MENINNILFRCSGLHHLMTEPRSKSEPLSEAVKTHAIDVYVANTYNRFTEINGKALSKGNETEEDSITIISRIKKTFYKKNTESLSNEFIKGTPDLYEGETIEKATHIIDAKSSWNAFTYFRAINKDLIKDYYWQGLGYMALTGATKCTIAYCLNNTPYHLVESELRKEAYKYQDGCAPTWVELQIIANHVYDLKTFEEYINMRGLIDKDEFATAIIRGFVEIPLEKRYFGFEFDRNDDDINRLYERIKTVREYIKQTFYN